MSTSLVNRLVGLWTWSTALASSGPDFPAALSEVKRWLETGNADEVRAAAMAIIWRARPELTGLAEPLASRSSPKDLPVTRLWAAHALYALQLLGGDVSVAPAFPALFALIEEDHSRFAVASFIIGTARRQGVSFAAAEEGLLRTLSIRSESAEIYGDRLAAGFVPPAHHKEALQQLLFKGSKREIAVRGLAAMRGAGHGFDDFVAELLAGMTAKTAKAAEPALGAAAGLVEAGVPLPRFFGAWEKALGQKTTAVRHAAHRTLSEVSATLAEEDRVRERRAAEEQGYPRVAEVLAKEVPPKRQPRPLEPTPVPPPLDLEELARQLRSDTLMDVRTAVARIRRAQRDELAELVPPLLDALATEERSHVLAHLTRSVEEGIDLRFAMPVVAGLLLDRDFYDDMSLAELLRFLLAALAHGHDIAPAWPWVPSFLQGARCADLRFQLAKKGLMAGLDGRAWEPWLLSFLVEVTLAGHPSTIHDSIRAVGHAADCLVLCRREDVRA